MPQTTLTIAGRVASDPQVRVTTGGRSVVHFRLADTERHRDADGSWRDGHTTFYTVNCWEAVGERVAAALRKGDPVVVHGKIQGREWARTDGAGKGFEIAVAASAIGPDLCRVGASVLRTPRQPAVAAAAQPDADPFTADLAAPVTAAPSPTASYEEPAA